MNCFITIENTLSIMFDAQSNVTPDFICELIKDNSQYLNPSETPLFEVRNKISDVGYPRIFADGKIDLNKPKCVSYMYGHENPKFWEEENAKHYII